MANYIVIFSELFCSYFAVCAEGEGDTDPSCRQFAEKGYCEESSKYYDYVMKICKMSCGSCSGQWSRWYVIS